MKKVTVTNKSGEVVEFITPESYVYDSTGRILQDKIDGYNSRISSINNSIAAINTRVIKLKQLASENNPFTGVTPRSDPNANICLLKDNNGVVTSDYGYTYDKLSGILQSGNYSSYIKNGDYILVTGSDGRQYSLYANIDTYYGLGTQPIPHHIDFIAKELIYGSYLWAMKSNGNNNGTNVERSPFLSCTVTYGATNGLVDRLSNYFTVLPSGLRTHIIPKYHNVPQRYVANGTSTADNSSAWKNMGYLWIPYEKEVFGKITYATPTYENWMNQYHSFSSITDFRKKIEYGNNSTSFVTWWLASAMYGETGNFVIVNNIGSVSNKPYYQNGTGTPLCFRFI